MKQLDKIIFGLIAFLFCTSFAVASGAAVTAVTTVTDLLATTDAESMGKIPFILSLVALFAIPVATQLLKNQTNLPKWVVWVMPLTISVITGCITAVAQGFMPWDVQGLNILLAIVMGGGAGQGVYIVNRVRVKAQ